jgi:hypothetical protein
MRDITQPPPEIISLQQKEEAKFQCSRCGADRGCDCNAPAVAKLAEIKEQARQRDRAYKERKRQEKQQSGDVANDAAERAEARCAAKWKAFTAEEEREAERTTKGEPMSPQDEAMAKLELLIINTGYETVVAQLSAREAIERLEQARDNLRSIINGYIPF